MGERESRRQIASKFSGVAVRSLKHQPYYHPSNRSPASPYEGAKTILKSHIGGTRAEGRSAYETRGGHHDQEIDRPERRDRLP